MHPLGTLWIAIALLFSGELSLARERVAGRVGLTPCTSLIADATSGLKAGRLQARGTHHSGQDSPSRAVVASLAVASLPESRGMAWEHDRFFQGYSQEKNLAILIIDSNPAATRFIGQRNFGSRGLRPKPGGLKECKTLKEGTFRGLVACQPKLFSSMEAWQRAMWQLNAEGFFVVPESDYLVVDSQNRASFSDYDVQTVVSLSQRRDAFTEAMAEEINAHLGIDMVQHPALDQYALRHQVGLKFPITVYYPGLQPRSIQSIEEMIFIYNSLGLSWQSLWGGLYR